MPEQSAPDNIPDGLTLRHTLRGHTSTINQIAWSPDGHCIASPSRDDTIRLWDAESGSMLLSFWCHFGSAWSVVWSPDGRTLASGSSDNTIYLWETAVREPVRTLDGHSNTVWSVSWSPDGQMLASGSKDKTVRLWSAVSGELLRTLEGHLSEVYSIAWSPDGRTLASGGRDNAICVWDVASGRLLHTLKSHFRSVYSVAWSPDGRMLAAGSNSEAIQLWDSGSGRQARFLEGHTDYVRSVSFSFDGRLLASKSGDRTVRLWRTDTWETVAILDESVVSTSPPSLAFHPSAPVLATLGEKDTVIRIWDLDYSELLGIEPETPTVHYANARVVLVGDTGVGKTGLGLVLTGRPFVPTESTHGRHVWAFDRQEAQLPNGRRETRETLLWDLAGQPGYRLVHQLSLNEVAVALVVFDARSETDPFSGVRHWERALRQAQRAQGDAAPLMFKYLVAARTDRGGIAASQERIAATMRSLGFDGYYETSAKEGWGIEALTEAIRDSIDWVNLPKVSSTELFTQIKEFLVEEKSAGHLLATAEDLYRAFLRTENAPPNTDDLRAQFETCIGRVESRGLIQRLSFGDLVLLQPELLAAYASAMINAARAEPDGLGCLHEEDARTGRFLMTDEIRLRGQEQERLLLLATIEEMLRHEIALREDTEHGPHLVFPSQFTREWPDEPDPEGKAVIFRFDGPVLNVYATLAVRLSRSGLLNKDEMWRNAATYTATVGGRCGIWLREVEEGRGELTLFYDAGAIEATRFQFEEYVRAHLQRRALPGSIVRRRVFFCPACGTAVTDRQAQMRRDRGYNWIRCNVCEDVRISLLDREERLAIEPPSAIPAMDSAADLGRDRDAAATVVAGKRATGDFDVFLCHNSEDKPAVKAIGERLMERGLLPWLDEWELRPGLPWQQVLEERIGEIESAAVFVGVNGIGPWQDMELQAFLRQFVRRKCPVIPVILPDCKKTPELPIFLAGMTWVDFRKDDPDPMEQFIWGITGERMRDRV